MADMTAARASVLHTLYSATGPITAQQVADQLGVSRVSARRLVNALERSGWLRRAPHPEDGRAFELRLTPKARRAFPKFVAIHNDTLDVLFSGVPAANLSDLRDQIDAKVSSVRTAPTTTR